MDEPQAINQRLERCFAEIGETRMDGVPILNGALRVRAVGTCDWQGFWLTALITPWFLNLMLLPRQDDAETVPVGSKRLFAFPAGSFEFIRGREESLGGYWMCSLFSPVLEFTDQQAAEATAAAALEALFTDTGEESDAEMAMVWRGELPAPQAEEAESDKAEPEASEPSDKLGSVSRRAFLRGPSAGEAREA